MSVISQELKERMLLKGEFLPIGGNLLYLRASPEKVVEAFIRREESMMYRVWQETGTGSLADLFKRLYPLTRGAERWCFIGTDSPWTLALHNDGDDFGNSMTSLGRWAKCETLLIQYLPAGIPSGNPDFPNTLDESRAFYYSSVDSDIRYVRVSCRRKQWDFEDYGKPLAFEDIAKYTERLKRSRLTLEMLESYARYFGIEPFHEEFYQKHAIFVNGQDTLTSAERDAFSGSQLAYQAEKRGQKVYQLKLINGIAQKIRLHVLQRFRHKDIDNI